MSTFKCLSLLTLLLFSITSANAQQAETGAVITLERTACRGVCPIYTMTIFEDGTVRYEGEDFVTVTGEQTTELEPETVQTMIAAFERAGYFDWDAAYTNQTVSDLPTVITSVTRNGETHRIERYVGDFSAPLALPFLEQWIDTMAKTVYWTGIQPDPAAISNGTDTPLITLEQTACFGSCPVYHVALFADGTGVFTGIANVDEIGVTVFEADPAVITNIAQLAQIFGYFEWQDNYDKIVKTDQVIVITAIHGEDDYKRIMRNAGDPTAPVGLLWVENMINQQVTDLIG